MDNCQTILQQGLQQLSIEYSEQQLTALLNFIQLMQKWNKAYNLTSVRQPEDMARLHILDSLSILPHLHGLRIADIGTGGGLPGIPLAIFRPDIQFTLVDANAKKTRFVQQALLELKLSNVEVLHQRVEQFHPETAFSSVMMRAFSSLQNIIDLTQHLIEPQGLLLAMKGQQPDEELQQMTQAYTLIPLTVPGIEAERCLIKITGNSHNG